MNGVRSTRVSVGVLAPAGVRWTTICNLGARVLKGGPLDGLLNSARPDHGQACAAVAVSPELVILRYARTTRRFVIDMGGCPGVLLHDGTKLSFTDSKLLLRAAPILLARSQGGPKVIGPGPSGAVPLKPPRGLSHRQRAGFLAGERVAGESGCEGCHRLGASGNDGPGPPLTHIGGRLPAAAIAAALRNPRAPMPSFANLATSSPKRFAELVRFLSMLR